MALRSELEKQGITRCCASFKGGGQCRKRASDGNFCKKHGAGIGSAIKAQECKTCGGTCKGSH